MPPRPTLTRYWIEFEWPRHEGMIIGLLEPIGFGVTASDLDDALSLVRAGFFHLLENPMPPLRKVTESVDVSTLDEHVRSNMHPPNWRGVWFPMLKPLR